MLKKYFTVFLLSFSLSLFCFTPISGSEAGQAAKIISYSLGSSHCLAVKSDGTLWAWGGNPSGQLGDGTQIDSAVPVRIGKDTDWFKVSAGRTHSLAIKKDGTLWAWGSNKSGELGDGTVTDRLEPVKIGSKKGLGQACSS